jgi:hypothetical protein
MGPLYASSSLGGGRRSGTSRTNRRRTGVPSPAQWDRARRQAERAQQEAQRDAAIAQLRELRRQTTSVHLQSFTPISPPVVPGPPKLGLAWALAEAQAHHLEGLGIFARAERAAAKQRAEADAPIYLAAEEARLPSVHQRLVAIAVTMDVAAGLTCGVLTHAALHVNCASGAAWTFQPPTDPGIRAMVVAELYRHTTGGQTVWKLRAVGQGWADGLEGLARAHGVAID